MRASGCSRAPFPCSSAPCGSCRATKVCAAPAPTGAPSAAVATRRAPSCCDSSSRPAGARTASARPSTSAWARSLGPKATSRSRSSSSSSRRRWTRRTWASCASSPRSPKRRAPPPARGVPPRRPPLGELARAAGKAEVLADRLLALVERRRRKAETGVAGALLLRVAELAERDFGDEARALDLHRRAEEIEPRSLAVLSGLARLAQKRGDEVECERIAALLEKIAAEAATPEDAAEALYRAVAIQLSGARTRDAGVANLSAAVEKSRDLDRASALVAGAGLPQADLAKI